MENIIVGLVILLILGSSFRYVYRQLKSGSSCMGCSQGNSCAGCHCEEENNSPKT